MREARSNLHSTFLFSSFVFLEISGDDVVLFFYQAENAIGISSCSLISMLEHCFLCAILLLWLPFELATVVMLFKLIALVLDEFFKSSF